MASNTYGAIKLSTAEDVGAVLKKKTGSQDGYKPKEWADTINLMGLLPVRTASGSIAHFTDGADDVPLKSLTAQIVPIQAGTGDPSPSNPRPISGTSVLNVMRTGANVWDEKWELGGFDSLGRPTPANDRIRSVNFTSIKPSTSYYFKTTNTLGFRYYDANKEFISSANGTNTALTTPSNAYFLKLLILNTTEYASDVSVNYPSTDTSYHSYNGSTYTVTLGQTVYGGSADVVGGTGEETYGKVDMGDLLWNKASGYYYSTSLRGLVEPEGTGLCETLKNAQSGDNTFRFTSNGDIIVISATYNAMTKEEFIEDVSNVKIIYELATPTDFTFTGQPINSYLGTNNFWADTGDTEVEYRADMNLLIAELEG